MTEIQKTLNSSLMNVIHDLKVPKNQYNSFGKYSFRNAEDIIDAVKPLLHKEGLRMKISDTVELIGIRYYVKATVTVFGHGESDETTAYARESEDQKGMNDAQITGSTSSYARKYALNGMFDIDDTKDADTNEYQEQSSSAKKTTKKEVKKDNSPQPKAKTESEPLSKAKTQINEELIAQGYDRSDTKRAFIKKVLNKETIDTLNDADLVGDALDNEKEHNEQSLRN